MLRGLHVVALKKRKINVDQSRAFGALGARRGKMMRWLTQSFAPKTKRKGKIRRWSMKRWKGCEKKDGIRAVRATNYLMSIPPLWSQPLNRRVLIRGGRHGSWDMYSSCASTSAGIELMHNEVLQLPKHFKHVCFCRILFLPLVEDVRRIWQ